MKVQKYNAKYNPMSMGEELDFSDEAFDSIQPKSTATESLGAMFRLSQMDTPTQSIGQYSEIEDAERADSTLIPVNELNEKYQDLHEPFTEPKNAKVAEIIAGRQRKRQQLGDIINNGPNGFGMGIARFGAAMLPHAIDPINIGSGVAVSALTAGIGLLAEGGVAVKSAKAAVAAARAAGVAKEAELAGIAARAARAADTSLDLAGAWEVGVTASRTATTAEKVLGNQFIRNFGEGVLGNMASETITARAAIQEGREYGLDDAFYNTVGGALLVPGAVLGFQKAAQGLRYTGKFAINRTAAFLSRIDPKYSELLQSTSLGRLLQDKLPKPGVFHEHAVIELHGEMPKWAGPDAQYHYTRLTPDDFKGRRIFAASYERGAVGEVQTEALDTFLGDGVYATDNPIVANGAAARSIKETTGRVIELEAVDRLNLIHLNEKMPTELAEIFSAHGISAKDLESKSALEIMETIQDRVQANELDPKFMDSLNEQLKAKGYDGYISDGTKVEGMPADPHNSVVVFNKEKLKEVRDIEPEPDKIGKLSPERVGELHQEAQSEISQLVHDNPDRLVSEFDEIMKQEAPSPVLRDLEAAEMELHENIADMEKQGLLTKDQVAQFEEVKMAQKDAEQLANMMKAAASCVGLD